MKSTKKRGHRSKRRCATRKRSKGGMQRAFRQGRHVLKSVFGETWPERIDKLNQMKDAALKGAADAAKKDAARTPHLARSQQFAVDPHRVHIEPVAPMHMMDLHDNYTDYTTPTKSSENKTEVPKLESRSRLEETQAQRGARLGSIVAPTSHHPDPIVKTLFPE